MSLQKLKYYVSTVTIRNGEYETLTNYCFQAPNRASAEKHLTEAFDIGGDNWEEQAELFSLSEVTLAEYEVLSKYI